MSNQSKEPKNPSVQWYAGMSASEKKDFEKSLEANRNNVVLHRLVELVIQQIVHLNIQPENAYDQANWCFRQADINGEKRGLRFVKDLLKFTTADRVEENI